MTAYYNEIDPYCVAWLRNLIDAGLIAPGIVDSRDIRDVTPADVAGFAQVHFFAGLGGWAYACRLAGWPDDRPIWTGSCPCQPFSTAGKRAGFADERHLWPAWHWLIKECRPPVVFGEQVASASLWLGLVRGDLEALGYAVGCLPVEAASVGAPHKRDRYWFVAADPGGEGRREILRGAHGYEGANGPQHLLVARGDGAVGHVADADQQPLGRLAVAWGECHHWELEPDVGRVSHGVPARVAKLRALGNAIVPQCAQAFMSAYMEGTA